jgi:hypothetical protein
MTYRKNSLVKQVGVYKEGMQYNRKTGFRIRIDLMRIRIRIQQLKLMRIHADPDPKPCRKRMPGI